MILAKKSGGIACGLTGQHAMSVGTYIQEGTNLATKIFHQHWFAKKLKGDEVTFVCDLLTCAGKLPC